MTSNGGHASVVATNDLPSLEILQKCSDIPVFDVNAQSQPFRALYDGSGERHLLVFIRHFYCGMCQDYVRALGETIRPKDLMNLAPPTSIAVIGCGSPDRIKDYISITNCPVPIYADPSRKLYDMLGMTSTLAGGSKQPKYQTRSICGMTINSIYQGLSRGLGGFNGGKFSQNGGEFLFENGTVTWCHRMKHTRDHTELADLRKVLEI